MNNEAIEHKGYTITVRKYQAVTGTTWAAVIVGVAPPIPAIPTADDFVIGVGPCLLDAKNDGFERAKKLIDDII